MMERIDLSALVVPGDDEYREFNKRIVATGYDILGIRMPALRGFAKKFAASPEAEEFLRQGLAGIPKEDLLYEDVLFYGIVLAYRSRKMPLGEVMDLLDGLIPHFDCWAHTDVIISGEFKIFARNRDEVIKHFLPLKTHEGEFHKRTFVMLLMSYFLDDEYIDDTLEHLIEVPQGQYYVDMAIAWTLATALAKYPDRTEPLLRTPVFSRFVHNKAIQKARESFRISPELKEYLKSLKI